MSVFWSNLFIAIACRASETSLYHIHPHTSMYMCVWRDSYIYTENIHTYNSCASRTCEHVISKSKTQSKALTTLWRRGMAMGTSCKRGAFRVGGWNESSDHCSSTLALRVCIPCVQGNILTYIHISMSVYICKCTWASVYIRNCGTIHATYKRSCIDTQM